MTGSSSAPIVIPIVAVFCLAIWLGLVYYADAHPRWKSQRAPRRPAEPGQAAAPEPEEPEEPAKTPSHRAA